MRKRAEWMRGALREAKRVEGRAPYEVERRMKPDWASGVGASEGGGSRRASSPE